MTCGRNVHKNRRSSILVSQVYVRRSTTLRRRRFVAGPRSHMTISSVKTTGRVLLHVDAMTGEGWRYSRGEAKYPQYAKSRFTFTVVPPTVSISNNCAHKCTYHTFAMTHVSRVAQHCCDGENGKMVNGFRYYRALESVSIASALSTALTIYPCQIRVHQR